MILASLRIAVRALLAQRLRSALTALGITIGTAAVVVVVALGTGARERIGNEIANIGNNIVFVFSQSSARSGARVTQMTLTESDASAIRQESTAVSAVTVWSTTTVRVHSEFESHKTSVMGIDAYYFEVRGFAVGRGRSFSPSEMRSKAKVVLVGTKVSDELFPGESPLGHYLRIGRHSYRVIGELTEKGRSSFEDQDDRILMPISTFRSRVSPSGNGRVQLIMASARTSAHSATARRQISSLLRQRHRLRDGEPDDFVVRTQDSFQKAQDEILDMVTTLLLSVAVVALFVGGVGVMNIMLVGVFERTREVGLRMAIGARPADILFQFLAEAVLLASLGGAVGVALSVGVIALLTSFLGWSMKLDPMAVAIAMATSLLVGVVFGILPARRASRLEPMNALRHE